MWWAKRASDESVVWPSAFADDAGVLNMKAARDACRRRELVCPDCPREITARSGSTRTRISAKTGQPVTSTTRAHFTHLADGADADCPGAARMSDKHLAAQDNIARVLQRRHPDALLRLEAVHAAAKHGRAGRSDIMLEPRTGAPLCIEVQASSLPVADLQERHCSRAAAGYVVEWIFIVDRQKWTAPLEPTEMLRTVLKMRGYVYLLEDPMSDKPRLWIAVAPRIASQIPDLRHQYLPEGHVHFLRVPRRMSDFTLVGTTPGAAALRCDGLHHHLERWMNDSQTALTRIPPHPVTRRGPAIERWRTEHERLERERADTEHARAAAHTALQQASADATTTAAAAATNRPPPPPKPHARRRDRLWHWLRPRREPGAIPVARDDIEHLAASARDRVRALRHELTSRDVEQQAANERVAEHAAQRTAAVQLDDAEHAAALQTARNERDARIRKPRTLINNWLRSLPNSTPHER